MSSQKAEIRRIAREARSVEVVCVLEDGAVVDGLVEVEVEVVGRPDSRTIAELVGGRGSAWALPQRGEVWLAASLGDRLDDLFLLTPVTQGDSDVETHYAAATLGAAYWAPAPGRLVHIVTRAAAGAAAAPGARVEAGEVVVVAGSGPTAVTLSLSGDGRVSLTNGSVEAIAALEMVAGYLLDTLTELATTVVATAIGPQPLSTAGLFAARAAEVAALRLLLNTMKR